MEKAPMHRARVGRVLSRALAAAAVLISLWLISAPAEASWSGWGGSAACTPTGTGFTGNCPTVQEACQSWAEYRGTWVRNIKPAYNSAGEITQYTCQTRHFLAAGADFQDPSYPSCPSGYEVNGNVASGCQPIVPQRALGKCTKVCGEELPAALGDPDGGPIVGNPISLATGNKFEAVTDYRSGGTHPLTFARYYNSQSKVSGILGPGWRHSFERRLVFVGGSRIDYHAVDGKVFVFNKVGSDWVPDSDVVLQLENSGDTWILIGKADRVESFDSSGRLVSVREKDGFQQALEYFGPNMTLSLVHDSHGHRLRLSYNAEGMLESLADDEGRKHFYSYRKLYDHENQPKTLLAEVAYPDETPLDKADNPRKQYLYEDPAFPAALTGVIDELGERYATWSYDAEGRAVTSEHASTTSLYTIIYNPDGSRSVTGPLGKQTIYHFISINGLPRISQIERLVGPNSPAATIDFTYDVNGFLASTADWAGNVTSYTYDSRGLLTSKTEAVGTLEERTTTTTWHNDFRVPTQIVAPRQTIDLTYDGDGLLINRQVTDTTGHVSPYPTNGQTRSWVYAYSDENLTPGADPALPDIPLTLVNPDAETGDTSGWTVSEGAFTIGASNPAPSQGSYYFFAGAAASSRMHQDIPIPSTNQSEVDSGLRSIRVQWNFRNYGGYDQGAVVLRFLDAQGDQIGSDTESLRVGGTTWMEREFVSVIPPLTRTVRLELRGIRRNGTNNDAYFDELQLGLVARSVGDWSLIVQNSGAEAGNTANWTSEAGTFGVHSGAPLPFQGDFYFFAGAAAESRLSQVIGFPATEYDAIDAGNRVFELIWRQRSYEGHDKGAMSLVFLDAADSEIGSEVSSVLLAPVSWQRRILSEEVPADARSVRIRLHGLRVAGADNDAYFDYLSARLLYSDVPRLPVPRQLISVDGPRGDVSDMTTFAYNDFGELVSVTNALNQVSSISTRDGNGLPLTLLDENGIETEFAYDARKRLISSRVKGAGGDAVTTYAYDDAGLLTAVSLPDGNTVFYEYDAAQRLTAIANGLGERIEYTLDVMGNRTAEVLRSGNGAIVRSQSQVFDELGRLLQSVGANSQITAYGYDANSNLTSIADPLSSVSSQAFDGLSRLVQQTDPLNGIAGYSYDSHDNLVSVTDPRNLVTTYSYNGFGDVIQLESPDTGATVFTLDAAGNAVSQTDSRGVVTDFTYDALNRPLTRSYPATPAENVSFTYDDTTLGNRGVGRLTSVTDRSGSTRLAYDDYGNLVEESRTIDGVVYTTRYSFDVAGNLLQMTYPEGRIVSYGRDALGRVASITTQVDAEAAPVVVASDVAYEPFGPVSSLTFGNGVVLTYSYDHDYRLTGIVAGDGANDVQDLTLAYDSANNITAITDLLDGSRSQMFQYDDLYRLTQATGLYGTIDYGYDAVGNRISRDIVDSLGTLNETYSYDTVSNRLLSLTDGTTTQSFGYSASGQIGSDDRGSGTDLGFVYDGSDRLVQFQAGGLPDTDYLHNAFGERVAKELLGSAEVTHFHYGAGGQLIAESDELGAFQRSYIYLDGMPIAQIEPLGGGGATQSDDTLDNENLGVAVQGNWSSAASLPGYEGADYLVHPGADPVPAGGTLLDNSSPEFSTTGLWPATSDLPGFEGAGYQSRSVSGPFATPLEVDNLDPQVTVAGTWTAASRTLGGHTGSNYLWRHENGLSPETIYLDNAGPEFSTTGFWGISTWTGGGTPNGGDFHYANPDADPADTLTVDNESPGFSSYGDWATSTWNGGGGRFDTNYRVISPTEVSPDAVLVDNLDAGFSVSGAAWNTSTYTGNGRLVGSNIFWLSNTAPANTATWTPTLPAAKDYRVYAWWSSAGDRATDATFTVHHDGGSTDVIVNQRQGRDQWNLLGTFSLVPGGNHRVELSNQANGVVMADAVQFFPVEGTPNRATWEPEIPLSQQYHVYAWWSHSSSRAQDATFSIHHSAGSSNVVVDQRSAGGQWNLLGTYLFDPGSGHRVEVTNWARGSAVADAVKFEPVNPDPSNPPPTATWTPDLSQTREYDVYARWTAAVDRPVDANYVVHHAGGSSSVVVDQTTLGGQWNLLGTYTFAPASNNRIEVSLASGRTVADAIRMVPTGGAPNSVTWNLAVPESEFYTLETRWIADANRATDAPFTVNHAGGSDLVPMNQQVDLGVWTSLGSYLIPGGGSASVVLTDQANGEVVADAVRLTADPAAIRSATWIYSPAESGDYRVFARWPAAEGNATDAKYTVSHAGGSSLVTVSQAQRGGQWNELGVFAFDGGQDYAVSLSDDANGTVVADALYIVKVEPLTDAVTWVPALPASGTYQVYAKWTSDETRATDAGYSIVHSGGTAAVTRNQRVGGGLWQFLGSYAFDPLSNPTVTLAANDNGSVAADAIRFVGGPGGATDIAYLHSDHLGTPQAMTDAGGQLLWWRDQTPFGQTVASGGFSESPLRFPGQYADAESGLAYNYFRDYDPALGRYIQSDPIGLGGGLNTYGYVMGNPLRYTDPTGELIFFAIPPALAAAKALGAATVFTGTAFGAAYGLHSLFGDSDDDTVPGAAAQTSSNSCTDDDEGDFCYRRYQIELQTCRGLGRAERARKVPSGSASRCYESAEKRFWACQNNRPEPPFHGWPQY